MGGLIKTFLWRVFWLMWFVNGSFFFLLEKFRTNRIRKRRCLSIRNTHQNPHNNNPKHCSKPLTPAHLPRSRSQGLEDFFACACVFGCYRVFCGGFDEGGGGGCGVDFSQTDFVFITEFFE